MNEQKMREAFADAFAKEVQNDQLTVLAMWSDEDGAFLNAEMQVAWNMWQAATASTQRDAMAVAEAVRDECRTMCDVFGAVTHVDLAAIVEAVRPGEQEPVNQQLLAALKDIANDYADRFDIASSSTNPGIKIVIEQARAAIAAAEAAHPASAQQQGEPVACKFFAYDSEVGFELLDTADEAKKFAQDMINEYRHEAGDGWPEEVENVCWGVVLGTTKEVDLGLPEPEYDGSQGVAGLDRYVDYILTDTAPPAPACSVPDVDVFAKTVGDFEACGETDTSQDELMQFANHGWLECTHFEVTDNGRAMLAATQKGGA